ncbi:member of Set1p complex, histone methyl transferase [Bachmanniomyces sp. S44760]|nr:member of Set1p complex, histone methyl transferase [Bachmanniomyces sp. S44760]
MAGPALVPPPPGGSQPIQKTSDIIGAFRPTKLFKLSGPETAVTSLDFDDSGEYLLAACSDETLQLYNAKEGKHIKQLFSKKYGAHLARFTHHSQSIIYASTKGDDTIRYLSTHDNQFLRYFKGHTASVTTLALCPSSDTFLSCSLDNTVRLWSLSSPSSQGILNLSTPTLAAYDPSATVIAIASPSTASILLYDLRNYDKPPFTTFDMRKIVEPHPTVARTAHAASLSPSSLVSQSWMKLEFSNDGKSLLLATNNPLGHYLLDAFNGSLKAFLARPAPYNPANLRSSPSSPNTMQPTSQGDVAFSSDGRYIIGSSGGERDTAVWDSQSEALNDENETKILQPMTTLPCRSNIGVLEFNPRFNMMASADREVIFWLPDEGVAGKP